MKRLLILFIWLIMSVTVYGFPAPKQQSEYAIIPNGTVLQGNAYGSPYTIVIQFHIPAPVYQGYNAVFIPIAGTVEAVNRSYCIFLTYLQASEYYRLTESPYLLSH